MHGVTLSGDQAERLRRMVSAPRTGAPAATLAAPTPESNVRPPLGLEQPASDPGASGISVSPLNVALRLRPVRLARAIGISSGKGGVGKTNLAVNLAVCFAARGLKVALLDADLGLANADVLCGLTPRATLEDVITGERTLEEVMVHAPGGFRLVPGASGVSRLADMGQSQRREILLQLMRLERSVDVLLVDTGAGIGANSMAFAAAAHTILITATPEPTSIADAYGAMKTLVARGRRDGLQLVVNMAMNEEEARAVHARMDRVSKAFLNTRIGYAGSVPFDAALPSAVRRREPVTLASPNAPASKALHRLAATLSGEAQQGPTDVRQGFLGRLAHFLTSR